MTSSVVRKISIGSDYKNEAMHYSLGQHLYKEKSRGIALEEI